MKIETRRLILRDLTLKDAKDVAESANDKDIGYFTAVIPYPYNLKDAREFIKKSIKNVKAKPRKNYDFGIELKINKRIIGLISLNSVDLINKRATIGYWLSKEYRKQGIISEAEKAVLYFAFNKLKLNKIKGEAVTTNKASNALFKKFEFRRVGILKHELIKKKDKLDAYLYELLKENWRR